MARDESSTLAPIGSDIFNSSRSIECIPGWEDAKIAWGCGWNIYTYGFSIFYLLLGVNSSVCLVTIYRKWNVCRLLVLSLVMLLLIGLFRGIYFAVDPYGYMGIFSPTANRLLFQMSYPALSCAYGSVQKLILSLTRLDVGSTRLQRKSFFASAVMLHFLIVILVETIVNETNQAKPLLLLSHGYFIIWTSFLGVTFVYNGFKLTYYTSETKKVLKDLTVYAHSKGGTIEYEDRRITRSSTQQRLLKPKIKVTNEENKTCSIATDSDVTSESEVEKLSDSTSFKIESNPDCTRHIYKSSKHHQRKSLNNAYICEYDDFSDDTSLDDFVFNEISPSTIKSFRDSSKSRTCLVLSDHEIVNHTCLENDQNCSKPSINSQILQHNGLCDMQLTDVYNTSQFYDTGYLADTESSFTKTLSRRPHNKRLSSSCIFGESEGNTYTPSVLPSSSSTLSLHRIRQGKMVHKLVIATYVTTFLGFVLSLLQVYTIFGSYGIFGRNPKPDPWPWLIFQAFQRFIELGMGASIGVCGWFVFQYRRQRSGVRKTRKQKTVKCIT